jgi:nucleoside-triphosphatase THEP1
MVNIITGSINSGKTSRIIKLYETMGKGDGFVSVKNMYGNKVHSYEIMQLSNKEKQLFILREDYLTKDWCELYKLGPYSFSLSVFKHIEDTINRLIVSKVTPIYLDEVGRLELENKCFHRILVELLESQCELYITVRKEYLDRLIDKYNLIDKINAIYE